MALNQDELNQLVVGLNTALSGVGANSIDDVKLRISNYLAGKPKITGLPPTFASFVRAARSEPKTDPTFVARLVATPGFPDLPAPTYVAPAQPPAVAAPAPAVVVAPVVAPQAPVVPVAPAPGPVVQPVIAPAPAGAAAPAGGQVFDRQIAREALDWVVDKIATMRSQPRQILLQEVAREQAQGLPLRQPPQQFRRWPRHLEMALSDLKLMASLNANYKADAIAEIDAAIPAPAAAPQVQQQPVIPGPPAPAGAGAQPVIQAQPVVQPQVVQQPAQAPAQAVAHGQQQVQPAAAQAAVQPIVQQPQAVPAAAQGQQQVPAPVAPVAPVVAAAAPTFFSNMPPAFKWAIGILAMIGILWLSGQFVSAFFSKLVSAEAKEQITLRDQQIERLNETVRVLRGDVSTAIEARDLAQSELQQKELRFETLHRNYNLSEIPVLRDQHAVATAELDSLRPEAASLREQLATAGRTAREATAAHTTQMRGLEQRIAALVGESEQMNGLIRQLQDPSNIGAPCDVDILTLNVSEGTNTTLRIRRWGEDRDQTFSVPGAGDRRIGRCTTVYNTLGGVHLWSVGSIRRQKLIIPAGMTVYIRYGNTGAWEPHRFNRASILLIGGDASLQYRNPDLAELAARR